VLLQAALLALCVLTLGCRQDRNARPATPPRSGGPITIDGSATLLPLVRSLADAFQRANSGVSVATSASGTGAGFQKLCAGEIDIAAASRPINAAEIQACQAQPVDFYELPVAFDSLSVVVSPHNSFASCLTPEELRTIWGPAAQNTVTRWNQVRPRFPDQALHLIGPSQGSGTFDYFTLAINGTEGSSRRDYVKEENPAALADRVAADAASIGYLGFAYYLSNKERLQLVAIDSGEGCVSPTAESVANETYRPLSRPVLIYVSAAALARPEVNALARFYLSPDNAASVQRIGYVPLPTAALLSISRHLDKNLTGAILGGRGSVVGLTPDVFGDDERVKSALVR
jgi:phosphate transport system substrate-binding protein